MVGGVPPHAIHDFKKRLVQITLPVTGAIRPPHRGGGVVISQKCAYYAATHFSRGSLLEH
jgi:hypothetical protein